MKKMGNGYKAKKMGIGYKVGVILSFLAISGVAESITGHGSMGISITLFVVGLVMCLSEYLR